MKRIDCAWSNNCTFGNSSRLQSESSAKLLHPSLRPFRIEDRIDGSGYTPKLRSDQETQITCSSMQPNRMHQRNITIAKSSDGPRRRKWRERERKKRKVYILFCRPVQLSRNSLLPKHYSQQIIYYLYRRSGPLRNINKRSNKNYDKRLKFCWHNFMRNINMIILYYIVDSL